MCFYFSRMRLRVRWCARLSLRPLLSEGNCAEPRATHVARILALVFVSVIPGRCARIEPGIHFATGYPDEWIPGSHLTVRPGMTKRGTARLFLHCSNGFPK